MLHQSQTSNRFAPYYYFPEVNISHGMFYKDGGFSGGFFSSLNLGFFSKDNDSHIQKNSEKVKHTLSINHLYYAKQVHGVKVHIVNSDNQQTITECDSLITNQKGVGLLVQQADCQAIMLFDPKRKVIANIHSGWRGSVQNIAKATVEAMVIHFQCDPTDVCALISPSLGPCCGEFKNYKMELPKIFWRFQEKENYFNFWDVTKWQLMEAGLSKERIHSANICTVCNTSFFSYRRFKKEHPEQVETGRNASVIVL